MSTDPANEEPTAVLGNMRNRDTFGNRFWFGDPRPRESEPTTGMLNILLKVRDKPDAAPDWTDAVTAFRKADAEVRQLAAERQEVADAIDELARQQAAVPGHEETIRHEAGECEVIKEKVTATVESLERSKILYRHILPRRPAVVRGGPAPVPAAHGRERPHDRPRGTARGTEG